MSRNRKAKRVNFQNPQQPVKSDEAAVNSEEETLGDSFLTEEVTSVAGQEAPVTDDDLEDVVFTEEHSTVADGTSVSNVSGDETNTTSEDGVETATKRSFEFAESDDYFDDDDRIVAEESDKVLHTDETLSIIKQLKDERVVTCEIINLFKENGKPRSRLSMQNSPPIFQIEGTDGGYASFVVTKELARTLEKGFGDIRKVYSGIDPTVRVSSFSYENARATSEKIQNWVIENKLKAAALAVIVFLIVFSQIVQ
jgi:hypothetical protein